MFRSAKHHINCNHKLAVKMGCMDLYTTKIILYDIKLGKAMIWVSSRRLTDMRCSKMARTSPLTIHWKGWTQMLQEEASIMVNLDGE